MAMRNTVLQDAEVPELWNYTAEVRSGVYEIDFSYEELSYRYRIDAESGAILDSEQMDNLYEKD